jgi:hypothetical protein
MKKILVTPLNWGLGHATRCMPLIQSLQAKGAHVYIASSGNALSWLKNECRDITTFEIPDYPISYSKNSQLLPVVKSWKQLHHAITDENQVLNKLQEEFQFDTVISDNRYGMWHTQTENIFICHQLRIPLSGILKCLQQPVLKYHLKKIQTFNQCWIPDVDTANNLSGIMSHDIRHHIPTKYIGWLSRFTANMNDFDVLHQNLLALGPFVCIVVLSGPEPQRTYLQKIVSEKLAATNYKTLIVQGLPKAQEIKTLKNITYVSSLNSASLKYWLMCTPVILCRSGYTSLMDLATLGLKAIVVPTPGQYEQMYLAQYHHMQKMFGL